MTMTMTMTKSICVHKASFMSKAMTAMVVVVPTMTMMMVVLVDFRFVKHSLDVLGDALFDYFSDCSR